MASARADSCGGSSSWWLLVAVPVAASRGRVSSLVDADGHSCLLATWPLLLCSVALVCVSMAIVLWAAPGGPAWGKLRFKRRCHNPIPGPHGWPVIGSLMVMTSLAHRRLAALAKSNAAKRLMSFSLGDTLAIVSSHPDSAKEILNSSCFADRPIKESAYQLMFDRAIGFAPYGDYWRDLRRIAATHLFSPRRIAAFEKHRQGAISHVLSSVESSMAQHGRVRVRELLQAASLNNIMRSVFGRSYDFGSGDAEAAELASMVREGYELLGVFNWGDHLPFLRFLDLQRIRARCAKLVPRVNAFVKKIIDDHKAAPATDASESDFVDALLAIQGSDDAKLSDTDMIAVLWEMIFRGTDTVAIVVEWVLARVAIHGDVQEKLHKELDEIVGGVRRVAESDMEKLVYLQAVVKEVVRMHPPGPLLSWARLAIHDTFVDGHMVPAGTTAMVNMWSIMHDSAVWAEPAEFRPERFISGSGGENVNIMGSDLRLAPFGSGRRVCPGKALGLATVHLWLARLLHHFEWEPASGCGVDLSEVLKLSSEMKTPLLAVARRRNAAVQF